jgi:hypothetical protein
VKREPNIEGDRLFWRQIFRRTGGRVAALVPSGCGVDVIDEVRMFRLDFRDTVFLQEIAFVDRIAPFAHGAQRFMPVFAAD